MPHLMSLGIFFAGFGFFLLGSSAIWWVSLKAKLIKDAEV